MLFGLAGVANGLQGSWPWLSEEAGDDTPQKAIVKTSTGTLREADEAAIKRRNTMELWTKERTR